MAGLPPSWPAYSVVFAVTGMGSVFLNEKSRASVLKVIIRNLFRFVTQINNHIIIVQNRDDLGDLVSWKAAKHENIRLIPGAGVILILFPDLPAGRVANSHLSCAVSARQGHSGICVGCQDSAQSRRSCEILAGRWHRPEQPVFPVRCRNRGDHAGRDLRGTGF